MTWDQTTAPIGRTMGKSGEGPVPVYSGSKRHCGSRASAVFGKMPTTVKQGTSCQPQSAVNVPPQAKSSYSRGAAASATLDDFT